MLKFDSKLPNNYKTMDQTLPDDLAAVKSIQSSHMTRDCSLKNEEWMTTQEAADFLKVSANSLRNMTSNGHIPYQKLIRRNRYLKSDLVRMLMSTRKGGFRGS